MKDEEDDGNRAPDHSPYVGTDPMEAPQEGVHKEHVHLDREKVREHDAEQARDAAHETPEERAHRIENS